MTDITAGHYVPLHDYPPVAMRTHLGTWIMATCLICTAQIMASDTEAAMRRFKVHYERGCPGQPMNRSDR